MSSRHLSRGTTAGNEEAVEEGREQEMMSWKKKPKTKSCDDSAGQLPNRVGASWMR